MHGILKLIFFSLIILLQGCQTMTQYLPDLTIQKNADDRILIHKLFAQAKKYQQMTETQKQLQCSKLKQTYKIEPHWQSAWLLVNALNDDFKCINLTETITWVANIEKAQEISPAIRWLNNNQLHLLNQLKNKKIKMQTLFRKNKQLQLKTYRTETQLKQAIAKIKALKNIETHVNKKIDDFPSHE